MKDLLKIEKISLPFLGFLQASGLIIYIGLISIFFYTFSEILQEQFDVLFGPMLYLLLFVLSAVVCASVVLGRAGYLFWEKKYKDSFTLIGWTVGWMVLYLALILGAMLFF